MFMCGCVYLCVCVNGAVMYHRLHSKKKEDKKKAEKEKMLNEPDPEKARKWKVCVCF